MSSSVKPPVTRPGTVPRLASVPAQAPATSLPSETPAPAGKRLAALGYALFALQRPGPLDGLPTLAEARAAPASGRSAENRGAGGRVDAFALLGEIGFLDI